MSVFLRWVVLQRPHLRPTNDSYRVDGTYVKIKGKWHYLYRAVDSTGQTIDFMLSAKRDARAAKRFFRKMLKAAWRSSPRVINVDKNPAYPPAVKPLKEEGNLPSRIQLRRCKYLNNLIEQDHRFIFCNTTHICLWFWNRRRLVVGDLPKEHGSAPDHLRIR
jgi:transposase, IS6 family